jgi:cytochrome d ubiquinol oxidase subunit I
MARRDLRWSPWFLRAAALSGLAAVVAMEAGWTVTEVGRQPWIVYGVMRTTEAVNPSAGLRFGLYIVLTVYAVLGAVTIAVLRRMRYCPPGSVRATDAAGSGAPGDDGTGDHAPVASGRSYERNG